jgi:hypothetical protein
MIGETSNTSCKPKVANLGHSAGIERDVFRSDVAMHNAFDVQILKPVDLSNNERPVIILSRNKPSFS